MRWIDSRRTGRRPRRKLVDVSSRPTTARMTDVPVAAVGASGRLVLPVPPAAPTALLAFAAYVPGPND